MFLPGFSKESIVASVAGNVGLIQSLRDGLLRPAELIWFLGRYRNHLQHDLCGFL
jgi:hypothetical protein